VIDVLNRQLKQLKAHLGAINERYQSGLESDYALMRQDVEVANIKPVIIEAERMKEILVNGLKLILAIPQEDSIHLTQSFEYRKRGLPDTLVLIERAREERPDFTAEKFREKSLKENIGAEKAGYFPNLSFSSKWYWQGQSDDWKFGRNERSDVITSTFDLSWPVFDGLKTKSRVDQAKAKYFQQRANTSKLGDEVSKDVQDAYLTLTKAREALQAQQKSLSLAKRATAIAGERFGAGLMSQIELNDTINAQARAEQQYLRAAYDCLVSEAALELAVGGEL
jgi:outer membrane protein TolC